MSRNKENQIPSEYRIELDQYLQQAVQKEDTYKIFQTLFGDEDSYYGVQDLFLLLEMNNEIQTRANIFFQRDPHLSRLLHPFRDEASQEMQVALESIFASQTNQVLNDFYTSIIHYQNINNPRHQNVDKVPHGITEEIALRKTRKFYTIQELTSPYAQRKHLSNLNQAEIIAQIFFEEKSPDSISVESWLSFVANQCSLLYGETLVAEIENTGNSVYLPLTDESISLESSSRPKEAQIQSYFLTADKQNNIIRVKLENPLGQIIQIEDSKTNMVLDSEQALAANLFRQPTKNHSTPEYAHRKLSNVILLDNLLILTAIQTAARDGDLNEITRQARKGLNKATYPFTSMTQILNNSTFFLASWYGASQSETYWENRDKPSLRKKHILQEFFWPGAELRLGDEESGDISHLISVPEHLEISSDMLDLVENSLDQTIVQQLLSRQNECKNTSKTEIDRLKNTTRYTLSGRSRDLSKITKIEYDDNALTDEYTELNNTLDEDEADLQLEMTLDISDPTSFILPKIDGYEIAWAENNFGIVSLAKGKDQGFCIANSSALSTHKENICVYYKKIETTAHIIEPQDLAPELYNIDKSILKKLIHTLYSHKLKATAQAIEKNLEGKNQDENYTLDDLAWDFERTTHYSHDESYKTTITDDGFELAAGFLNLDTYIPQIQCYVASRLFVSALDFIFQDNPDLSVRTFGGFKTPFVFANSNTQETIQIHSAGHAWTELKYQDQLIYFDTTPDTSFQYHYREETSYQEVWAKASNIIKKINRDFNEIGKVDSFFEALKQQDVSDPIVKSYLIFECFFEIHRQQADTNKLNRLAKILKVEEEFKEVLSGNEEDRTITMIKLLKKLRNKSRDSREILNKFVQASKNSPKIIEKYPLYKNPPILFLTQIIQNNICEALDLAIQTHKGILKQDYNIDYEEIKF